MYPYLFLSPYFLLFIMFSLFPIIFSFIISFEKWNGFGKAQFIGLNNYITLLHDTSFYQALFNTFIVIGFAIPLQLFTAILLAVFIKSYFRGKLGGTLRLVHFLPYITTPVAVGMLYQLMFDWRHGTINMVLQQLHLIQDPINWLGTATAARFVTIVLVFWKYFGYMMVIVFAGLATISEEVYEAAALDGASGTTKFFRITLPLLKPILTFLVITNIIGGIQLFDEPTLLFPSLWGGPDRAVMTIVMKYYEASFGNTNFGYGSAMAYATFILILAVSLFTLKLFNRREYV
jgi:cellobiose transport system permease protein